MGAFAGTERFAVRRKLGAGAMGTVYHAHDRETGSDVAIKVLTHVDPPHIQRFKNEFRRLADLQHPNLVQLGELFSVEDQWFFTMELVQGSDLMRFVRGPSHAWMVSVDASLSLSQGELPFDDARLRAAMRQLAIGTAALHDAQIVHRDIKPSNVVASHDGRVVLLDFGLATPTLLAEQSHSSRVVGTIAYMAPEQAAGKPVAPAADWYSVGVVLYEALTGKLPFTGNGLEIMLNKQRHEPTRPRALFAWVPEDLDELCMALLRHDPEQRPRAREVLERLGVSLESVRTSTSRSSVGSQAQVLVGREAELARLEEAFARRGEGQASVIAIRGASGVGKSALAREFCERCQVRAPGVLVLSSRCYERESVPYKAFDGIVDGLSRDLSKRDQVDVALLMPDDAALVGRLFPGLRQVPAVARIPEPRMPNQQELRKRAFSAMRQLLVRVTRKQPLVLCIDDFQWADPDSLALLAELLHGPGAPPLMLITTIRDGLGNEQARSWLPPAGCAQLEVVLANLTPETSELLARQLLASEDLRGDLDLALIAREAQGHPLFLLELVRHAALGGSAQQGHVTLDDALWTRARQLDAPALRLLQILSIASRPLPQKAAFAAADLSPAEGRRWSGLLRVAHLARTGGVRDGDSIEPYHDRVRESVLARLEPALITALHARIAAALESFTGSGAERQAMVFHLAAAGQAERARELAVRAADDAEQVLAFERAAGLYLQAIELGHPDVSTLWSRRGDALAAAGRGPEAAQAFEQAARSAPDGASALEGRRRVAEQLLISGHITDGMAALRTVLDGIGVRLPATALRALLSMLFRRLLVRLRGLGYRLGDGSNVPAQELSRVDIYASVAKSLSMVDTLRGADFQARHLLLALRIGEPARVARALAMEACYACLTPGGERRAARALRTAESLSERTASPWAGAIVVGAWGLVHYQRGRLVKAREASELGEQRMVEQCTGVAWELDTARFYSLYSLFYLGELRELAVRAPELLRDAEQRGDLYAATNIRVGVINASWLVRGEVASAREALATGQRSWTTEGFHVQHWHAVLAAEHIRLYAGEHADGRCIPEDAWPAFVGAHFHRIEVFRIEAIHLRGRSLIASALALPAERKRLLRKARGLGKSLLGERAVHGVAFGQLLLAACAHQAGASERAVELLTRALKTLEQADMHLYAEATRWSLALLLGGHERELGDKRARRWADQQGIVDPARWRAMLLPGLP